MEVATHIQLRDLGDSLGRKRISGEFKVQGTCPVAANIVLFLLNEI